MGSNKEGYMTYMTEDILEDECVDEFISSCPIKEITAKGYILYLKNYANYLKKLPSEMILEAEREQDTGVKSRRRSIKKYLNGFANYMKKNKYSPLTIGRTISGVKSFYIFFDIAVPRIRTEPAVPSTIRDLPTMDEIRKVVRSASTRDKAIVLLHLSSGFGRAEVMSLRYVDFLEAIGLSTSTPIDLIRDKMKKNIIPTFIMGRVKMNSYEYISFCSPEAVEAIIDYLEEREDRSEWLFTNAEGGVIAKRTYVGIFERLNDRNKLGLRKNKKSRRFTSHQLRRVFASNLLGAGVPKERIDFMLGHREDKISEAYFKTNPEELKKEYIKGLNSITLNKINIIDFESDEVKRMKEDFEEMKQKLEFQNKELALQKKVIKQLDRLDKI